MTAIYSLHPSTAQSTQNQEPSSQDEKTTAVALQAIASAEGSSHDEKAMASNPNYQAVAIASATAAVDSATAEEYGDMDPELYEAIANGNTAEVQSLIDAHRTDGLFLERREKNGDAALSLAASFGRLEIVEILIKAGANLEAKNKSQSTALLIAAYLCHKEIWIALRNAGADLTVVDWKQRDCLCRVVVSTEQDATKQIEFLEEILRVYKEEKLSLEAKDAGGRTSLLSAIERKRPDLVKALIDAGANVEATDEEKDNPLSYASFLGLTEIMNMLIKAGANLERVGGFKLTPLMVAAHQGHVEICAMLLKAGANAKATDSAGNCCLHHLILKLRKVSELEISFMKQIINHYVSNNISLEIRNSRGITPFCLALSVSGGRILEIFVNAGVDLTTRSLIKKHTIFHIVVNEGWEVLLSKIPPSINRRLIGETDAMNRTPLELANFILNFLRSKNFLENRKTDLQHLSNLTGSDFNVFKTPMEIQSYMSKLQNVIEVLQQAEDTLRKEDREKHARTESIPRSLSVASTALVPCIPSMRELAPAGVAEAVKYFSLPNAFTQQAISSRFRALMRQLHPDSQKNRGKNKEVLAEKAKTLNGHYATLLQHLRSTVAPSKQAAPLHLTH